MEVWPTILRAGPPPTRYPNPVTPTRPIAMPTGTRRSINANRLTKPMMATASVLIDFSLHWSYGSFGTFDLVRIEHEPIGPDRDQHDRRHGTGPGDGVERPGREAQVEGGDVVVILADDLVDQRVGLHRHYE